MTATPPPSLPEPTFRIPVPMRDGVRLDTAVWLPKGGARAPAIFLRTPYNRSVNRASEGPLLRYLEAGYAVVLQQVRGIGRSGGRFGFNAPHDRSDGYDSVEWIAAQAWCTGAVGMDGHSYAAMTQLTAAAAAPPSLRCIAPAVPSCDFFQEPPYIGGVFSRMHTLVWGRALMFEDMLGDADGEFAMHGFLTQPELLARWTRRPLADAADGELTGDQLQHYRDVLDHPTFDDWWRERTLGPADFARMDLPVLLVTGNFDPSVGALALWRGLEAHAGNADDRHLVIGPWDHNGCYVGGRDSHGPYSFAGAPVVDVVALRLAFFDRHLKGEARDFHLPGRVSLFITGENRWIGAGRFPLPGTTAKALHLDSGGHANGGRGDGRLADSPPLAGSPPDRFADDPAWPFVGALTMLRGPEHFLDLTEREANHETLVYSTAPLEAPLTLAGETALEVHVAADAPDADLIAFLAEQRADGRTIFLGFGQLRLRYREGFETERPLPPGEPVIARLSISYIAHRLPAGSRLRLLLTGNNFPLLDPNPHVAGPIATAATTQRAELAVFHDAAHPSRIVLPLIEETHR